ncbi:class I histocompatibility antigen, F10 alpha chain-like [Engraulis encrasicolus]|uniref:class I histocompatibility antigen, F10 alpha chain-like n=1 Tax=Engraulis encrasicolus TaxID=184585 RepID=UPI002FD60D9D
MVKMGFLSLVAVLCCAHLAYGEIHSMKYFYTATSGIQTFPEFVTVLLVDGQPASYYDSNIRRETPRQDWMKNAVDADYWDRGTQISIGDEQSYKANIDIAKQRFNQTGGMHSVQNMYGCQWDDETHVIDGYDQNGYDGEDFVTLDLKNLRYIATTPESQLTVNKWNSNPGQLAYDKQYYTQICIEWLKKYVEYGSSTLGKKVAPEVSLLQKGPEVACHATGFHPDAVMITWKKDGVEVDDDVDVGETLPNEDGTFQKRSVLTISPKERTKTQYSCEVTHKSGLIEKILDEAELKTITPGSGQAPVGIIIGAFLGFLALIALIGGAVWYKRRNPGNGFVAAKTGENSSRSSDEA